MPRWLVGLAGLLLTASSLHADDAPRPLIWAADLDGGVPYVFKDEHGNPAGFEVDIKDALARVLARPIEFRQYEFESLISGLERGDFDFAMNGLEITPEREQQVRFTRPYYLYQLQLVARQDETRFTNFDELRSRNLTVATLGGTVADRLLDQLGVHKRVYTDQDSPYRDLRQKGGVDAVLLDLPIALYYAVCDKDLRYGRQIPGLKFAGPAFAEGYYGIAVQRDNERLAAQLDAALATLSETGELKRILQKWELWNPDQYRLRTPTPVEAGSATALEFGLYLPLLFDGAYWTVIITLASMTLAVLLGMPLALGRLYGPAPVRWFVTLYVEFFRGIPVLLLLLFLYFGLPGVFPSLKLDPLVAAILGFGLNYAAYESEIYRAGIASIPPGQWEAAAALGLSRPTAFGRVIFPQALRVILAPMTNDLIALFKDTSVASVISVIELSKEYQILTKSYGGFVQIGLATALLYLVMSVPLGLLSRRLEQGRR